MRNRILKFIWVGSIALVSSCALPPGLQRNENKNVPAVYASPRDSVNTARVKWNEFFKDQNLLSLIDTALKNNQELNIIMQEIRISNFEVMARKGAYLPMIGLQGGVGVEKAGRYTRPGAIDATTNIAPGTKIPDLLPDYLLAANLSWEVDIWKKLRNARKSAIYKYLSTTEGKNFAVTNLVAEIASSYYELMALDNQLVILKSNIEIQQNALEIVKMEKIAARVTELAVRRFEAEVLKNQSRQFSIMQQITQTENRINFLVGRFPQPVQRSSQTFNELVPDTIHSGLPSQLLENRPDVRQAEMDLAAAKLDVKVAKANFYPSLIISGAAGYQAFDPKYLLNPESMIFAVAGQLVAPLINRNAIKATYYSASSRQVQAVYNYERTILNGYVEVANQLANINNLRQSYDLKAKQVDALVQSITISTGLFKSARADYMEVLLTQRDALEARFELVETKMQQMNARVNIYRALGGGWR